MNPFEKIFNYQILSRLEDSGTIMITASGRSWLKTMLQHPAAIEAFSDETWNKLSHILEQDQTVSINEHLLQKAPSKETHVYHPFIKHLRQAIMNKSLVHLSYETKDGSVYNEQQGLPYKMEYSMVKREWYLLWYRPSSRMMMSTKLQKLVEVREQPCTSEAYEQMIARATALLEKRKASVNIRVVKEYNQELSRILYAFSCFEKEVCYLADKNEYTIRLSFANNETEYVLSKTRFLGKRVHITDNEQMQRRMLESATKALGRYGF